MTSLLISTALMCAGRPAFSQTVQAAALPPAPPMTLLVPVSAPSFSPGALRPLAPVSLLSVSMPLPVTSPARQSVEVAPLPMRAAEPAAAVAAANKRGGTESDGIMDRVFDGALPASSGDGVVAEDPRQEAPAWEQTVLTELPRLL